MQKTSSLPDKPFTQHFVIWVYKPKVMPKTETEVVYLLSELCRRLNLTLISTVVNLFSPHGITAAAILSQSHLVIHTWPEREYLRVDLVICVNQEHDTVERELSIIFEPEMIMVTA
ncbi:hypothetical protein A2701_04535 [Candidatus Amesbacteria bacterium RIFCSPHIGHO2_01_FULL_47_34]|uniref:S-adenosylmethionine decarboxylase proenzyme n=3 Tax=Candidatus Amesiibacteriota TaxID=1752730 RepID=A0A0G1V3B4_9BACT|nr:MAG: S-adenosylmethionine decarboxylase proenzyme [Candidatus Amesbacteria bacterium GW2011_GWC1_47_15]KKU98168.1 MAG: S-adenosylmethionine decarboxylase proenzyme [Candidatus Amesbacteria bacterium GW2011_GWB1_48_13]OGC99742.1 MAG: hypothetical protein A2972_01925 [Candidatus Amesbacteria bacterium RIFCSPLOWO2_01_FULL_47_33]OGD00599.1 MAG: hypothetical protein A2701_04535 [Candidatus Amesbacteria bacterium RIFCSPHIGHO2_01_FULL_47_34]